MLEVSAGTQLNGEEEAHEFKFSLIDLWACGIIHSVNSALPLLLPRESLV